MTNIYRKVTTTRCASVSSPFAIRCRRRPPVLATWRCSLSLKLKTRRKKTSIKSIPLPPGVPSRGQGGQLVLPSAASSLPPGGGGWGGLQGSLERRGTLGKGRQIVAGKGALIKVGQISLYLISSVTFSYTKKNSFTLAFHNWSMFGGPYYKLKCIENRGYVNLSLIGTPTHTAGMLGVKGLNSKPS